ncbi:DNA mismatch repair protein MutS [Rubrivivax gelatinosus]|nr:DNA mismatch repair protein MutS [Rubrivivax gelatinosus]
MKISSLKELQALRAAIARREREAAERAERERREHAEAEAQRRVFAHAVGPVYPLAPHGRAHVARPRPAPLPRQREADERAALRATLSDEVDVESLLLTDDGLSFRRFGVGPDVLTRLRRGHWAIQTEIDLHGLRRDEARDALAGFIRESARRGQRCVRVVHGKGHGSPGRKPVLKVKAQRWLAQCAEVIAFTQATGPQGGAGALIVLLS